MGDKRLGEFEEVLLLLVGILNDDAYALRIAQEFKSQTGKSSSIGAVHATLARLSKKGFLTSKMGKPSAVRGGRRKRIYEITAAGQQTLAISRDIRLRLWNQFPGFSTSSFQLI
ncbi:MAG: PadR family transcriptional regulator [Saprospiraceae bacterium]|nr:PadR family transcriptional regulator [Saprospiraceae bacterium]